MTPEDALRALWSAVDAARVAALHDPATGLLTLTVSWAPADVPEALRALAASTGGLAESVAIPDAVVDEAGGIEAVTLRGGMYVRTAVARLAQRLTAPRPLSALAPASCSAPGSCES